MTGERPWRCFVAVPIGGELRAALAAWLDDWRARPDLAGLRWSDSGAWHVTLAFIGAIEVAAVGRAAAVVERVAEAHRPVTLRTGGLGAFPRPRKARVAWYGIADPEGRLGAIAGDLAAELGLGVAGPYRPHLTLARTRSMPIDLRTWLADAAPSAPEGRLEVERLELMRSHLGSGPARYETLATASLG